MHLLSDNLWKLLNLHWWSTRASVYGYDDTQHIVLVISRSPVDKSMPHSELCDRGELKGSGRQTNGVRLHSRRHFKNAFWREWLLSNVGIIHTEYGKAILWLGNKESRICVEILQRFSFLQGKVQGGNVVVGGTMIGWSVSKKSIGLILWGLESHWVLQTKCHVLTLFHKYLVIPAGMIYYKWTSV